MLHHKWHLRTKATALLTSVYFVHFKHATPAWSDSLHFSSPKPDVDRDCQAMLELLEAERSKAAHSGDSKLKVDEGRDELRYENQGWRN